MKLLWRPLLSSKMHLNSGNTGDRVILSLAASDLFWHLLSELFSLLLAASGRHSLRPAGWPSCSPPKDHTPRMAARPLSSLSPQPFLPAQCRVHSTDSSSFTSKSSPCLSLLSSCICLKHARSPLFKHQHCCCSLTNGVCLSVYECPQKNEG